MGNAFSIVSQAGSIFTGQLQPAMATRSIHQQEKGLSELSTSLLHEAIPGVIISLKAQSSAGAFSFLFKTSTGSRELLLSLSYLNLTEEQKLTPRRWAEFQIENNSIQKKTPVIFMITKDNRQFNLITIEIDAYKPNSVPGGR